MNEVENVIVSKEIEIYQCNESYTKGKLKTVFRTAISSLLLIFAVYAFQYYQSDKQKDTENAKQTQQKSSGKNGQHINQQAKGQAKENYENAKNEFEKLDNKPRKTKEEVKLLEKLKKQVKHWKKKMDNTGENHSQKAKGN